MRVGPASARTAGEVLYLAGHQGGAQPVDQVVAAAGMAAVAPQVGGFAGIVLHIVQLAFGVAARRGILVQRELVAPVVEHGCVYRRIPELLAGSDAGVAVQGDGVVAALRVAGAVARQRGQVHRLRHQRRHLRRCHAGGAQQGGRQVVRLHQIVYPVAGQLPLRQAQDHRHPGAGVVEVGALGDQIQVADHVAVIRHEQDQRIVRHAAPLQFGEDAPDLPVHEGDRREVAVPNCVDVAAPRVGRPALPGVEQRPLASHPVRNRLMGGGKGLHRRNPRAVDQRARGKRIVEIGVVRIEQTDVEEERPLRVALLQEGDGPLRRPGVEVRLLGMMVLGPGEQPVQKPGMMFAQPRRVRVER